MWSDEYEKLSSYEKGEFRRVANYLLSHTYIVKYKYDYGQQMTVPNYDYTMAIRLFPVMREYFGVTGWMLEKDDDYGIMSLINSYDHNRLRIDEFTTLFLYTCRMIYEEKREQSNNFHIIRTSTQEIVEKMRTLGIIKKGKTTQKERIDAQRTLAHYNIIQKLEASAWNADGNELLIMPSILYIISNQGINDMIEELKEFTVENDNRPEDLQ